MERLADKFPDFDDSHIRKEIEIVKNMRGATSRVLRIFACFYATLTQSGNPEWLHWIDTAHLYAYRWLFIPLKDTEEYKASRKAAQEYLARWKGGELDAAACLAAAATLNRDVRSAAIEAACWYRARTLRKVIGEGYQGEALHNVDFWLVYDQGKFLHRFAYDHCLHHSPTSRDR